MAEKKITLVDFITEIPNKKSPSYQAQVDKAKMAITLAMRHEIDEAKKMCKKHKLDYDQNQDNESYAAFCEWRGKIAGLVSGERKKRHQAEKLVYLFELLSINHVPQEHITYTLIQFISKQLDGKSLDKEKCLELRTHYKPNKSVYQIPEHGQQLWAAIRLNYLMADTNVGRVKRNKI